jgi:hypothetical protein
MENTGAEISSIDANIASKFLISMTKMHENTAGDRFLRDCSPFPPCRPVDF